jgi:hypothetical protein
MKPHGALTKEELLALVKPGWVLYKVFKKHDGVIGYLSHAICTGETNGERISTTKVVPTIYLDNWFEKDFGFIFDNYFHALAYSMRLKHEHQVREHRLNHSHAANPEQG